MLTMLFAVFGGLSPHSSRSGSRSGTSWPGRSSRQASSDRHLAGRIDVHPSGDNTSSGPRTRKRIGRPFRADGGGVCGVVVANPLNHDLSAPQIEPIATRALDEIRRGRRRSGRLGLIGTQVPPGQSYLSSASRVPETAARSTKCATPPAPSNHDRPPSAYPLLR